MIDDRGELKTGNYPCDYIRYSTKLYAYNYGIRSMSPSIIIADELSEKEDFIFTERAVNSGVKVIATCHGNDIAEIKRKDYYKSGVFNVFCLLDGNKNRGKVKKVEFND